LADKHDLFDDRIYWKMAVSLRERGYDVYYLLIGDEVKKGITKEGIKYEILKIKTFSKNRYLNFILKNLNPNNNYKKLLDKAKEINADVYHFHDLWINKIGKRLKLLPQKPSVIYDVHDPFAINIKDYVGGQSKIKWLINLYADYIDHWEKRCAKQYDFIITTEENVRDRFRKVLPVEKVNVIYNYTYLHEYRKDMPKKYNLIYCGGITKFRGAIEIIEAVRILKQDFKDLKMIFLGPIFLKELKEKMIGLIKKYDLTDNIIIKNSVSYHEVIWYYNQSKIGLGIFLPIKTHKIILQIKIFEYMAMGLPIVGSNFGHINDYILKDKVGITVNPTNPEKIAEAVKELLQNEELYNEFKTNGINAVEKKYTWSIMENKLFSIYDKLLAERINVTNYD